jgi:hypothetical protein
VDIAAGKAAERGGVGLERFQVGDGEVERLGGRVRIGTWTIWSVTAPGFRWTREPICGRASRPRSSE